MRWRLRAAYMLIASAIAGASVGTDARGTALLDDPRDATPSQLPIDKDSRPGKGLTPPQRLRFDRLKAWVTAVEQHLPGAMDAPLREIARWDREGVAHAVLHFRTLVLLIRDPKAHVVFQPSQGEAKRMVAVYLQGDLDCLQDLAEAVGRRVADSIGVSNQEYDKFGRQAADALVLRAAWVHTDLALLGGDSPTGRPATAFSDAFVMQLNDGQQTGAHETAGHFAFARTILTYGRRIPAMSSAVALWYRATAAHMQQKLHRERAHLEEALQLFPRDADVLFYAGASHEMAPLPRVQEAVEALDLPYGVTIERALPEASGDTLLTFYAQMFLGREAEALGDLKKARASYADASRLYPPAQSPLVALSALAKREGNDEGARDAIDRLLGRSWAPQRRSVVAVLS